MQEIDKTTPKNIVLSAYWPRQQADEPHIGYGEKKGALALQFASIGYSLATTLFNFFVEPKIRPVVKPAARLLVPLAIATVLGIVGYRYSKSKGYYQLDDQGNPVLFLSPVLPVSLLGRLGVGRKEFLEQISNGS